MDAVREYLVQRGVGRHVVDGGLNYLVTEWRQVAADVERGRASFATTEPVGGPSWYWEEWVNDLDKREILQGVLDNVPETRGVLAEVEAIDSRFMSATSEEDDCQWGAENEARHEWTPEKNRWYWRRPPFGYLSPPVR